MKAKVCSREAEAPHKNTMMRGMTFGSIIASGTFSVRSVRSA